MAEQQVVMPRFLAALKLTWDNNSLAQVFTGGFYRGQPPQGTKTVRPYLIIDNLVETDQHWTNQSITTRLAFDITVVGDDADKVSGELFEAAWQGILDTPTDLSDDMRISLRAREDVRYRMEINYHMAVAACAIEVRRPR